MLGNQGSGQINSGYQQQVSSWPPLSFQAQQHNHYIVIAPADRALLERLVTALERLAPAKKAKRSR